MTLVEVNFGAYNHHVEKGVLEEASLRSWINPVSEIQHIIFQYI
jgi:hypothetical protein